MNFPHPFLKGYFVDGSENIERFSFRFNLYET
jgi:hypothetical protein